MDGGDGGGEKEREGGKEEARRKGRVVGVWMDGRGGTREGSKGQWSKGAMV